MTYILGEVNTLVPGREPHPGRRALHLLRGAPAAVRPDKSESAVPRTHILHEHGAGLEGVVTGRRQADDLPPAGRRRCRRRLPSPGPARRSVTACRSPARSPTSPLRADLVAAGVPERTADRLLTLYGRRAADVVAEAAGDPDLLAVFDEGTGAIGAELLFAVRRDFAVTLADVLARRVLAFEPDTAWTPSTGRPPCSATGSTGMRPGARRRSRATAVGWTTSPCRRSHWPPPRPGRQSPTRTRFG